MPDTKIFIDTDEELTFLVEKIRLASTQNVVVIVPDRASIFITSASLKLLKKSIDKLDKKVILVTMDESGKKLAETLNFVTVSRVRDVNSDIWQTIKKYSPVRKNGIKKNNVIRDLPKEYTDLDKPDDKEEVADNDIQEAVLPNIPEEKFEFPNSDENNTEEINSNKAMESEDDISNIEVNDYVEQNNSEVVEQSNQTEESVLRSDEEVETLEKQVESEIVEENNIDLIDPKESFKMPEFKKKEDVSNQEVYESPAISEENDEDELVFFEGEDIAFKNVKKKSSNLHLRRK